MNNRLAQFSFGRLAGTFTAEIYSQSVTAAVQVVQVPVLLLAWGQSLYGEWLILSAIALYLAVCDLGYTYSAKNEMSIRAAKGDFEGAISVYQSIFILLLVISTVVTAVCSLFTLWVPVEELLSISVLSKGESRIVLLLLVLNVLLFHFMMLLSAGVRCAGRPAVESSWVATSRLAEFGTICLVAVLGGGPLGAAASALVTRLVFLVGLAWLMARIAPWLHNGIGSASLAHLKTLFQPSLGFMLIPLSHTLLVQGPVLVLAAAGSTAAVVIYSTSRTIARLGMSAMSVVNASFIPEYSFTFGGSSFRMFRHLLRLHLSAGVLMALTYVGAMVLLSGPMMYLLTAGELEPQEPLLTLLVVAVALEMVWSAALSPLAVLAKHASSSYALALISLAAIVLSVPATEHLGVLGPAWCVLVAQAAMVAIIAIQIVRLRSLYSRWDTPTVPGRQGS